MKKVFVLLFLASPAFAGEHTMKEYIQQEYRRDLSQSEPSAESNVPNLEELTNRCIQNLYRYEELILRTTYSDRFGEETQFLLDHYQQLYQEWYDICGDDVPKVPVD